MKQDKNKNRLTSAAEIRSHAEERLRERTGNVHLPATKEETQRLLHELEVHQIELEMQNAELHTVRNELEQTLGNYTDLYDFAPVGYATLDNNGSILDLNLTGASLLGGERRKLVGRRFGQFLAARDRPVFTDFITHVFTSRIKEACEVSLQNKGNLPLIVQIEAIATDTEQHCRLALIDITARKQVETALHETEDRLYKLAEMAGDAIVMMDDSGKVNFCNTAAETMFGSTSAEITHCDFHKLFIPEHYTHAVQEGLARFSELGTGQLIGKNTEVVAHRKDGTEFPLELSISSLNLQGKWHAIGIMRDISERRRLITDLQKSEEKFSKIFHAAPALISVSTLPGGKYIDVNEAFLQTLGYRRDEVIGKTSLDFGLWEDESERAKALKAIEKQESIRNMEVRFIGKSGIHLVGLLSAEPLQIEDDKYILTLVRDITDRKQLETEVQDAREYAESIIETVRRPLVLLNIDFKVITANRSFYSIFKTTAEETIGNNFFDLGNRQWDIPALKSLLEEILKNESGFNYYEVTHDFVELGHKIIQLNARLISRKKIGSRIILLSMEDITDRKQLETEIQDAREYAENIVETVREPMVVLDADLKVLTANHSFYDTFKVTPENTIGNFMYDLGNRQWDIPRLRVLIEEILPLDTVLNNYEVEHDFLDIGRKTILLNARQIFRENIGSRIILLAMEDITERKRLEAEIQDAKEFAENIVETVREPLVVLNAEMKVLTANQSFYDTFKVTPKNTIGNFMYDLGNRQWDIPRLRVLVEEILPQDTVINDYEVDHDFLDIGRKIILLNARQIFREKIGSRIILLAMEDITDRKRLETEIQVAREYAENIVETVREPMVVLDADLKVLTANHNFYETFKVTSEDTIGNFIYDLGNRQWDVPGLRKLFEEILPLDTVFNDYEVQHEFPGIGHKTILLNARQIFREEIGSHIILLAMEDITDRKLLETEIQNAREYAENIVETVREPLVVLDADLKVLTANHNFYETFKVTPEDTIGYFIYDLGNRQWDIPKLRVLIEEILPHDTVINGYEVEHDFPGIGHKTILLNARQIFREEIGSHIILLAMEDITDRKLLETEIQNAREYAENIVETVREPMVVLDADLKVLTANQSFYDTFKVMPEDTIGYFIYDLGNRQWDIPKLQVLIEEILPHDTVINGYEVEHDFPGIGHKTILLNARQIFREEIGSHIILLAMEDITDRKLLETEIQNAREYAENIVETVREPLVVLDADLKVLTANQSFYDTFKVMPKDTIGYFIYDLGNRQWDIPKLRILIEDILPLETVFNGYEVEHDFQGIGRKIIRLNAREIFRKDIGSRVILLAMEDITDRKLAEERISEVIRQQQAILDNIPNIAWLKDKNGKYVAVNEPFGKALGKMPQGLIGKNDYDIYPRELAKKYEKEFRGVIATGKRTYFEESIVGSDGIVKYVEKIKTPIFNDAGVVIGIIGIAHDITSRKEVEVTLRHDSTHDGLTGLYNRAFFDEELKRLTHSRMFPLSIVMADVNGLKSVNDTQGHEAGDNLIRLAARIILRVFRTEDIVARIGGDEFAILLPETGVTVAEEAVERINRCPEISSGEVSIAFGVASAESEQHLARALKLSDERMYTDKKTQKDCSR